MEIQVASLFLKDTFPADFATGSYVVEMTKMSCSVKSVEIPGVNDASLSCIFPERNTIIFHGSVEASLHELPVLQKKFAWGEDVLRKFPTVTDDQNDPWPKETATSMINIGMICVELTRDTQKREGWRRHQKLLLRNLRGIRVLWGANLSNWILKAFPWCVLSCC